MRRAPRALLTVRSALILGASCALGVFAAALTLADSRSLAAALLAAGTVAAGAITLLDQIIGDDTGPADRENDGDGFR